MNKKNLDTIFALEFGQLLENFLYSSIDRDEQTKIICSSLGLKNQNQLAQIFAGYDVPTTASIFELIRTLNDQRLTDRFLNLQTTLMGVKPSGEYVERETNSHIPKIDSQSEISGSESGRDRENTDRMLFDRVHHEDSTKSNPQIATENEQTQPTNEWGDDEIDFSLL